MEAKKGISLTVLVITIFVMIIIASVIIMKLQDDNTVLKSKKVKFQNSVSIAQENLTANLKSKEINDFAFDPETVNATTETEILQYMKSIDSEIVTFLKIQNGQFVLRKEYVNSQDERVKWIRELKVPLEK